MQEQKPGPLRACFWLTNQEKTYILVVCIIALIGLAARYFYLKSEEPKVFVPAGVETSLQEQGHE